MKNLIFRPALAAEQRVLEELQRRASLVWEEDRAALLQNPDAIELPIEQITGGCTVVAECDGVLAGFTVVLPRADGDAELDGLFVEPALWRQGIGRALVAQAEMLARGARGKSVRDREPARARFLSRIGLRRARRSADAFPCGPAHAQGDRRRATVAGLTQRLGDRFCLRLNGVSRPLLPYRAWHTRG